jgi:hypothetical protein
MDVTECIAKLVSTNTISKAIGDEAREMFRRSKAEYSAEMGPASADAAAALEAAKKLRDKAAANQIAIAADVKTFRMNEQRLKEDPRGTNAALLGILTKDTTKGDQRLNPLKREQPDHPVLSGSNADYRYQSARDQMYSMLGPEMEKMRPGFFNNAEVARSTKNFVYERFGVSTGDDVAKVVSDAFGKVSDYGVSRARAAGKVFDTREDWRLMQPWSSSRVGGFTEAEFVKDFRAQMDAGGLKLWDKETNAYAKADRYDHLLKKAYSDIKTEGGESTPFSKEMRTFEFQGGKSSADSWLNLQGKYGLGNEIMGAVDQHLDHMARTIALHETFGAHPDAQFAALLRMVRDNPAEAIKGLGWLQSETALQNTYNIISGKGHPVANQTAARLMSGVRNLVGAASLRNLPITIGPSDTMMTFLAANHLGMSGFNVLSHVFDGKMTKEVARHLQIASHSYMDYIADSVRRYEDQINWSGLARKVPRAVIKWTGADLWTTNGRLGWQVSMLHQIGAMRDLPFEKLDSKFRNNFLGNYGFTAADWDKIRAPETFDAGNGARYLDTNKIEPALSQRLVEAIKEQGSYAFHQPDARTEAVLRGGAVAGSMQGEFWLTTAQYKQFALERMTTHIMRVLTDGPIETRIGRGLAFTALSMAAGAVSLQTAAVLAGKDPINMSHPKFWVEAFAKGGAGGIYGDLLAEAITGGTNPGPWAGLAGGPIGGLATDAVTALAAPAKHVIEEPNRQTKAGAMFATARRWTPNTWYTKLAMDRLLWDKMQVLADPHYRQSFSRAQQRASKEGQGFWWSQGDSVPSRAPDLSTAIRH